MTNLDKVRAALGNYYFVAITTEDSQLAVDAQAALSAHEEEVRELVAVAEKFATGAVGHADFDRLTAALDKVKE